jgi:hypothetical protein
MLWYHPLERSHCPTSESDAGPVKALVVSRRRSGDVCDVRSADQKTFTMILNGLSDAGSPKE